MFDRFGEFDSSEELNRKAEELRAAGAMDDLYALAQENGIDKEDAEDYANACVRELTTPFMAAVGKLEVEGAQLELGGVLKNWKDAVVNLCSEDAQICAAVRKKEKNLVGCIAEIIKFSFENKVKVSDRIVGMTTVMENGKQQPMRSPLYLGMPDRAQEKQLIRDYYMK